MASRALLVLAVCAVGAFCQNLNVKVLQERQQELMHLFNNINEPLTDKKCYKIATTWNIEDNLDQFNNATAAKQYSTMIDRKWLVPRSVPYSPSEPAHNAETFSLFNTLYSAKTYDAFYKTAVYVRDYVNEGLYVYVLAVTIMHRPDTQGIALPPLYEVFPSFFNYGEVINTALKAKLQGYDFVTNYPTISMFGDDVVINSYEAAWPYHDAISPISYFTNDYAMNAAYYYDSMLYPFWLGKSVIPGIAKDRRGEDWWFNHKQIVARYYLERLSAGLGEIPEITDVVSEGFSSGLVYENGIPIPSRPDNFHIDDPKFAVELEKVKEAERRLWDSIEKGYYIDSEGKQVPFLNKEGISILGNLVQSNTDSPNPHYYKDFIRLWKAIIGNSLQSGYQYPHGFTPLVLPSALENYQTALRDPAFYMIWKRVLRLFQAWHKRMPLYTPEELSCTGVAIENVKVDKLETYFDKTQIRLNPDFESISDKNLITVRHMRLNHKPFTIRIKVKSDVAKTVLVKFFLAPKYDSKGNEIPLRKNTENFFLVDAFLHDLQVGENLISQNSSSNGMASEDVKSASEVFEDAFNGDWTPTKQAIHKMPARLLLPKGREGGMPYLLVTYIHDYAEPSPPPGTGFNSTISLGLGSGARYYSKGTFGFPADRTLLFYQVAGLKNMVIQTVKIFHDD